MQFVMLIMKWYFRTMKLLEIKGKEKRTKVLTVRLTESAYKDFEMIREFLEGKLKAKVSQADLLERWIAAAREEMKTLRRK